jgi:G protein-coupled receptor GPR1
MVKERVRIHKQLRLIFIYPLVYTLMWLIPFAKHCMNYKDEFAAHPVYWLTLLSTICFTSMGAVDCLIFSLRERPWRHIPSSDGSFLGSFMPWRRYNDEDGQGDGVGSMARRPTDDLQRSCTETTMGPQSVVARTSSFMTSHVNAHLGRPGRNGSRTSRTSRSSDHQKGEAETARLRLQLEKEDRRRAEAERENRGRERDARRSWQRDGVGRLDVIESPPRSPENEIEGLDIGVVGEDGESSEKAGGIGKNGRKGSVDVTV